MKLLFDHNLSHNLVQQLAEAFPQSSHVRLVGLARASDTTIWEFARQEGYIIVTLDSDFFDLLNLRGAPPRVIWLRCGNQPTAFYEKLLHSRLARIIAWSQDPTAEGLEIFPFTTP